MVESGRKRKAYIDGLRRIIKNPIALVIDTEIKSVEKQNWVVDVIN